MAAPTTDAGAKTLVPPPAETAQAPVPPKPKTATPALDLAAWEAEARHAAQQAVAESSVLLPGSVIDGDPKLRYVALDLTTPERHLEVVRQALRRQGYRKLDGLKVVGFEKPEVWAVPAAVYRDIIRPARVAKVQADAERFPKTVMVKQPTQLT